LDKQPTDATIPEVVAVDNQIEFGLSELVRCLRRQIKTPTSTRDVAEIVAMGAQRRMLLVALRLQKIARTLRLLK
jgi:uncharacterized protein (DUF3084 family)